MRKNLILFQGDVKANQKNINAAEIIWLLTFITRHAKFSLFKYAPVFPQNGQKETNYIFTTAKRFRTAYSKPNDR